MSHTTAVIWDCDKTLIDPYVENNRQQKPAEKQKYFDTVTVLCYNDTVKCR